MRTNAGAIWVTVVAVFVSLAAATQFRSQDVYARSLNLETPSSLTTLIANLSETNNELRAEIFDLRRDADNAQNEVASGRGTLTEGQRQLQQLRVFSAESAVAGPGIVIRIEGAFDERAMSDLVNELRNAGAEAIGINEMRVGPRSFFTGTPDHAIAVDGRPLRGPWIWRAIGDAIVGFCTMTRTSSVRQQSGLTNL